MIVAIISTSVIALGLFFILLSQQKRIAALSANEARLEAKDAQLDGKDALLAQSEALLAQKDVRIEQVEGQLRAAEIQLEKHRDALDAARGDVAAYSAELAALKERVAVTESERAKNEKATADHFRNLANEIFETQTARFKENSEKRLEELLAPFRTNLDDFRKTVSNAYSEEARERYSLQNEIRNLMELNRTIGKEAQDLTRALKGDSKVQGDWGEMILERLLEMSGLQKGVISLPRPQ